MKVNKTSYTYRLLERIGKPLDKEKYGQISMFTVVKMSIKQSARFFVLKFCMFSILFSGNDRLIRPRLWRYLGVKVGKRVTIGYDILIDIDHASNIIVEDDVCITSRCLLLCHKRDLTDITIPTNYNKLPHIERGITLKKGSYLGMGTIVMPGVTIGEGAMTAAGSIIVKDVDPWTIVGGNPAKVIRQIPPKSEETEKE